MRTDHAPVNMTAKATIPDSYRQIADLNRFVTCKVTFDCQHSDFEAALKLIQSSRVECKVEQLLVLDRCSFTVEGTLPASMLHQLVTLFAKP